MKIPSREEITFENCVRLQKIARAKLAESSVPVITPELIAFVQDKARGL
jgi:hypothetical protein